VYGKILSCRVKRLSDAVGIGWMEYESYEQAQTAQRETCGESWGTRITVKFHRDGGGENYDPNRPATSKGTKPVVTNGAPSPKTQATSIATPSPSQPGGSVAPTPSKIPATIPAGLPPPQAVMPLPPHAAQPPLLQQPPQHTAPQPMPVPQPQLPRPPAMQGPQAPPIMRASLPWIPQVPLLNTDKVKLPPPIAMQPPPKDPVVIPARDTRVGIGRRSPRSRSPRRRRSRPRSRERRRRISPPTSRRRSRDRRSPVRERDRSRTRKRTYSRRTSSRPLKRSRSHSPPPARRSPVSPRRRSPISPRRTGSPPVSRRIPVSPQPEYDTRLGLPRPPLVRIDEAREKEILYGGVNGRKPRSRSRGREIPRERSRDRERSRRDRERDRHRSRERVRERSWARERERDRVVKRERSPDYLPPRSSARPRSAYYDERRPAELSSTRDAYEKAREAREPERRDPYSERRETYDPPRDPYDKPRAPPLDRPASERPAELYDPYAQKTREVVDREHLDRPRKPDPYHPREPERAVARAPEPYRPEDPYDRTRERIDRPRYESDRYEKPRDPHERSSDFVGRGGSTRVKAEPLSTRDAYERPVEHRVKDPYDKPRDLTYPPRESERRIEPERRVEPDRRTEPSRAELYTKPRSPKAYPGEEDRRREPYDSARRDLYSKPPPARDPYEKPREPQYDTARPSSREYTSRPRDPYQHTQPREPYEKPRDPYDKPRDPHDEREVYKKPSLDRNVKPKDDAREYERRRYEKARDPEDRGARQRDPYEKPRDPYERTEGSTSLSSRSRDPYANLREPYAPPRDTYDPKARETYREPVRVEKPDQPVRQASRSPPESYTQPAYIQRPAENPPAPRHKSPPRRDGYNVPPRADSYSSRRTTPSRGFSSNPPPALQPRAVEASRENQDRRPPPQPPVAQETQKPTPSLSRHLAYASPQEKMMASQKLAVVDSRPTR